MYRVVNFIINKLIFLIFLMSISITIAFAHPGSLDSNSGHWNHKTGEYHYHTGEHTEGTASSSLNNYNYEYKKTPAKTTDKTLKKNKLSIGEKAFVIVFGGYFVLGFIITIVELIIDRLKEILKKAQKLRNK